MCEERKICIIKIFGITSWDFRPPGLPGGARQCPRSGHFLVYSKVSLSSSLKKVPNPSIEIPSYASGKECGNSFKLCNVLLQSTHFHITHLLSRVLTFIWHNSSKTNVESPLSCLLPAIMVLF